MKAEIAAIAVVGVLILFVIRPALKDGGSHGTSPPMSTSEIYSKLVGKTFACADPFLATFTADEALSTSKNSLRITIKPQ